MEVIIDFIGTLIKIVVLSSIYSFVVLGFFILIGRLKPNSWFSRVATKKTRLLAISGLFFSVGLLCFLFTYWGFRGFGDGPRIPIGHGLIVDNTNWTEYGYIEDIKTTDNIEVEMTKFTVLNDKLIGNLDSWFYSYKNSFFIYDMVTKEMLEFNTQAELNQYLKTAQLGTVEQLQTFRENYWNYWGGLRFWLLP